MSESKITSKDKKEKEKSNCEEITNVKYVDFKNKEMYGLDLINTPLSEELKIVAEILLNALLQRDNLFKLVADRIENLEMFLFLAFTLIKKARGNSFKPEDQIKFASMLHINEKSALELTNIV